LNRNLKIFFRGFLIGFLILACVPDVLCMAPAPIVYVAGDGSGDFNCDGKDDHIQINQALQFVTENPAYTTVYLKGPFTYVIADTLLIGSNTILEGDSSAKIKLVSNARWKAMKPMIKERSLDSHDITIRGFTIDGNREGNTNVQSGREYYNILYFTSSQNIDVNHMTLTNNHDDGLEIHSCTNVKYHENTLYLLGHDGIYAINSSNVEAYNNNITCRTNSGLRAYNTNHVSFHDNTITSQGSGGPGIEIQKENNDVSMDDIAVYNNVIYETSLAGIMIFGSDSYPTSSANVLIHHNQIYNTGTDSNNKALGGILSDGFNALIENNVIDGAYGTGIMLNRAYYSAPSGSGYVITVRNNIITNTRKSEAGGNGSGICNLLTDTHSFVLQNNCFYNNKGGNYIGVQASPSDIAADPQYADRDKHDYRLKSKIGRWDGSSWVNDNISSPCIDAGDPLSGYSNEPKPNGKRTNMGPDGNTIYASKSESNLSDDIIDSSGNDSNGSDSNGSDSNSGSSHSGGSSGGGGSPELQSNVEVKELSQAFITSGNPVKFDFPMNATPVVNVSFDAKKTAGKTTTIVETLKNKSTLVSGLPSDEVYKSLNIWVGNSGFATPKNIENAVVYFKVEKSWIQDKKIDQSSIILNRYSDGKWNPLSTKISVEDDRYLYFTVVTPGFSSFAITGKITVKEAATETQNKPNTGSIEQKGTGANVEQTPEQTQGPNTSGKGSTQAPGFEVVCGIVSLLAVFLYKRK